MESGPTQAVLPLVGLAAEKVIRDRYKISGPPGFNELSCFLNEFFGQFRAD
ncbi:MAG: hypothetical protein R6U98_16020 [Pirellulaceae bacterium]